MIDNLVTNLIFLKTNIKIIMPFKKRNLSLTVMCSTYVIQFFIIIHPSDNIPISCNNLNLYIIQSLQIKVNI